MKVRLISLEWNAFGSPGTSHHLRGELREKVDIPQPIQRPYSRPRVSILGPSRGPQIASCKALELGNGERCIKTSAYLRPRNHLWSI